MFLIISLIFFGFLPKLIFCESIISGLQNIPPKIKYFVRDEIIPEGKKNDFLSLQNLK